MNPKKCAVLALIFIALLCSVHAQTTPWPFASRPNVASGTGSRTITVAFWNIQWFPGRDQTPSPGAELSQINSVHNDVKKLEADIIGMEEVRNFEKAALAVQPLAGFKVDVCANFPPGEGRSVSQEVAIASRLQPLSAWAEPWKGNGAVLPPRGFAFAAYQVAPKQLVMVYALHLKSNHGDPSENIGMREESIHQLLSHCAAMEKAYSGMGTISWVIGGDCNTSLDDSHYAQEKSLRGLIEGGFTWAFQTLQPSARLTMPAEGKYPPAAFDHIFFKNATLRKASVVSTSPQSSDHRAVVATFDLPAVK